MKLRITESQLNTIKKSLNEGVENQYSREVNLSYYYNGVKLNGSEIESITDSSVTLTFNIELEGRGWGIKNISISNIKGPSEVEVEVEFFERELQYAYPTILLDWDKAIIDTQSGHGVITVGDEVDVTLVNTQDGGIAVKSIEITVYSA